MNVTRTLTLTLVVLAPVVLAACGGGSARSETEVTNTTVSTGQQLIDLQTALEAGAITQEEYDAERASILDE